MSKAELLKAQIHSNRYANIKYVYCKVRVVGCITQATRWGQLVSTNGLKNAPNVLSNACPWLFWQKKNVLTSTTWRRCLSRSCCLLSIFIVHQRYAVNEHTSVIVLGWYIQASLCIGTAAWHLSWLLQVQQQSTALTTSWLTKCITQYQIINT